jgi:hypothetical protein
VNDDFFICEDIVSLENVTCIYKLVGGSLFLWYLRSLNVACTYDVLDLESSHVEAWTLPWKQFRHFTDHSVLKKMEDVCCMLGQYGDLNILSYHLLDIFHSTPYHRKEITFLLNEILCGGKTFLFTAAIFIQIPHTFF